MNRRLISKRFAFSATTAVALTFVVCCAAALVWPVSASRHAGTQAASAAATNSRGPAEQLDARLAARGDALRGAALRNSDGGASNAATPAGGTLSPSNRTITYAGGPFTVPTNSTDSAGGPVTCDQAHPCEDYNLTIDIPQSYKDTHPTDVVKVVIAWDDPTGQQDLDAFLVNNPDDGNYPAHADNGGTEPETIVFPMSKIVAGAHNYFVRVVPFISTGQAYTGTVSLVTPPAPTPTPPTVPFVGIAPRYYEYAAPPAVGENAGEPSIGYNPATHRAMYIAGLQTLQVTFPEDLGQPGSTPEACDAEWKDVSNIVTKTQSLDPILFTDQTTGRTFVSQLDSELLPENVLVGLNSLMAFSDDDGATWTPAQVNPPDGSNDHQTVGAGPYPASVPLGNSVNKGHAVYYCAQANNVLVATSAAFCSRSDDGGLNFGKSVPIYSGLTSDCSQMIHGHVKVAPDGTVYVPNSSCGGKQTVAVSTDAGTTWTLSYIPDSISPTGILDPSVAIASDGTVYFFYTGKPSPDSTDNHVYAAVSKDRGATWSKSVDIGISAGVNNAVFATGVAGDPDRAACGFLGTATSGDHQNANFKGTWYAYVAHTYDGGKTWVTVNASPKGPVQRDACIWNGGGNNPCRNLLDFIDVTKDEKGRVLLAYADGCVEGCEEGGPNSYASKATIARQSGGRGLFAQFDPTEPVAPKAACLSGRRDDMASYLHWVPPDDGGSALTSYKIFRATTDPATETLVGQTGGGKTSFDDRTVSPSVANYTYRIVARNAQGDGPASNLVTLSVGPRLEPIGACALPGVTVITDPVGDLQVGGQPQHDITSISVAEPDAFKDKLVFTIKVVNLSTIPAGWRWAVRFGAPQPPPDDPVTGPQEDWFVSMVTTDNATPTFTYGTTGVPQNAARVFTTLGQLDPASNAAADGTITLVLPKSVIGNPKPGDAITSLLGSVRATAPSVVPSTGGTNATIMDSTGAGSYQLRAANLCLPNTAPLARLAASTDSGLAPLTVNFDASGSSDPDTGVDTVSSYTFNFGDGGDDVTQSSPVITHTFTKPGEYAVRLVVTDSRGKTSANTDMHFIEAEEQAPTPTPTPTPTPGQATTVQFGSDTFSVTEGCVQATITVKRTGPTDAASVVSYSVANGTATQRGDFTYAAGRLTFAPGETEKTFPVLITRDGYAEGSEAATLILSAVSGASVGSPATATLQINDPTGTSSGPANPIDDAADFVGQHYHDFLNRQADDGGQQFWTNALASCGDDAACRARARANVSSAFFLSIEFQNTGYFVVRFYKTAFGDQPGTPRYVPFLMDTQQIGRGVVVGQGDWKGQLEANKQQYALDFVSRPEFQAAHNGQGAGDFVGSLFANAGVAPTEGERDAAVSAFGTGDAAGQARALRSVADSGSVYNKLYNAGFVLSQYFGYLRRNPNDAPDGDFSGYNFWLSKLNSFSQPGDDVRDDSVAQRRAQRAEMVRAFIESAEYRERFAGGANRGEQQGALAQARPAGGDAAPSALVEALLATRMIRMP
jgi:PKD repeat protein